VVRGHAEAAAAERIVVGNVGTGFAEVPGRDIIGKEAGEPQGVVAQVHHDAEAALAPARLQIRQNVHEIAVPLVVVPVDAPGTIALPEVEQQRGQVVGQLAVVYPGAPERMPYHDVEEQRLGRHEHGPHRQEAFEQFGRIQQRIRPLRRQPPLDVGPPMGGAAAQ
jgi:hypothetical protein